MTTILGRFVKSLKNPKPELSLRRTKNTTVAEILDNFAPPREGVTGAQLVTFGRHAYFLVIQGPEAQELTRRVLNYIEALHAVSEKSDEHSD